ncbi:long-chain fatty acid transport protein 2-like isoform X2 [Phyllopteryx taeniolatus]|uniref:long-chain fatty acid transport protein 2-like isoform X2 n=1 Tax=Phyllopteryx taeniolatus TaxID=161469 RepID=UPI002AD365E1|nr:long-chain fatty acid transport protein 2-like isoform X2 [Phyllopteryx taeniolatus]
MFGATEDVKYIVTLLRIRRKVFRYIQSNYTILEHFLETAKRQPHKPLLLFKDETFTYQDADRLSNQAARVLLQSGLVKQGDTVTLFVANEPMFAWLWLALFKLGCSAALLNSNIRSKSLLHCFKCSGAQVLLVAQDLQGAVEEVLPELLEQQVTVFFMGRTRTSAGMHSFTEKMSHASSEPIAPDLRSHMNMESPAVYVYTSGTTGLPKAAVLTHTKLWHMTMILRSCGLTSDDVLYISLPLYHTSGLVGFAGAIELGITVALKNKFSSSQFWDDCRKYNVTVVQYIGEIMRFICNTPKKPNDRSHKVRLAIGNGIRANVWRDFLSRFGNIRILELYGATEGNFVLVNYCGKIGAVGRDNFLYRWRNPFALIKYDVDQGEPLRDSSGLCIQVPKGKPGLLVSAISARTPFLGYARDLQQTEKKKLHDVLKKGDVYFNTGDLMLIDKDGFVYFQDRVGDTFRWKGENVSTNEVSDVITQAECVSEASVYGVEVPDNYAWKASKHRSKCDEISGWRDAPTPSERECFTTRSNEGRVGMAAIALKDGHTFDSVGVFEHLESFLPNYARPRFIRIQSSLDVTGTFKLVKAKLVQEGFNPSAIMDPLYFLDDKEKKYVPLTMDIVRAVISGNIKI